MRRSGFTLVEVILVASLVGLMAAISVPALLKARKASQEKICLQNLRLIEDAMEQIMITSNFVSTSDLAVGMLDDFLKAGGIADLSWPEDVDPPGEKTIQESEDNGLYVIFYGSKLRLQR